MSTQMKAKTCRICSNTDGNITHTLREMMFGYRDEFIYIECSGCGCLQISKVPDNMEKYYPDEYASFGEPIIPRLFSIAGLKSLPGIRDILFRYRSRKTTGPEHWLKLAMEYGVGKQSRILDVGCGLGHRLIWLSTMGFVNLYGLDPYIGGDRMFGDSVCIYKSDLDSFNGTYDFIMLHHVFEHMEDPVKVLRKLNSMLADGGILMIRTPVFPSYAWDKYGVNWVQLDAPRHFFIHSEESMRMVAEQAGLAIDAIRYDSTPFQFIASEMYEHDLPLIRNMGSGKQGKRKESMRMMKRKSEQLNRTRQGDQACFFKIKVTR